MNASVGDITVTSLMNVENNPIKLRSANEMMFINSSSGSLRIEVRVSPNLGWIGPKWDKSQAFSDQFKYDKCQIWFI